MKDNIIMAIIAIPILSVVLFGAFMGALWNGKWGGRDE